MLLRIGPLLVVLTLTWAGNAQAACPPIPAGSISATSVVKLERVPGPFFAEARPTIVVRLPARLDVAKQLLDHKPGDQPFADVAACVIGDLPTRDAKVRTRGNRLELTLVDDGSEGFWYLDTEIWNDSLSVSRPSLPGLASWSARIEAGDIELDDPEPFPDRSLREPTLLEWVAAEGELDETIEVGIVPPVPVRITRSAETDAGRYVYQATFLLSWLVLAALVYLLVRREAAGDSARAAARLRWILLVALATVVLLICLDFGFTRRAPAWAFIPLPLAAFAMGAVLRGGSRTRLVVAAAVLAGISAVPHVLSAVADEDDHRLEIAAAAAAVPSIAALTYLGLAGIAWAIIGGVRGFGVRRPPKVILLRLALLFVSAATAVESTRAAWRHASAEEPESPFDDAEAIAGSDWFGDFAGELFSFPRLPAYQTVSLLPYVVAAALVGLLYARRRAGAGVFARADERGIVVTALSLVFAIVVVGMTDFVLGYVLPLSFVVSYLVLRRVALTDRVERFEESVRARNPPDEYGRPLIVARRVEVVERLLALEAEERQDAELYRRYAERELLDPDAYRHERKALAGRRASLRSGAGLQWSGRRALVVPPSVSLGHIAFTTGPSPRWWVNGVLAVRKATPLLVVPLGLFAYFRLTAEGGIAAPERNADILFLFLGLFRESAFWLTAAFVLGALYPHLRGANGLIKGATLAAVYFVASALSAVADSWYGLDVWATVIFRWAELLLFLVVVGVLLDREALRRSGLYWRHLLDLYRIRTARVALAYFSPAVLALATIAAQILSGEFSGAVSELVKNLPKTLPAG